MKIGDQVRIICRGIVFEGTIRGADCGRDPEDPYTEEVGFSCDVANSVYVRVTKMIDGFEFFRIFNVRPEEITVMDV